MVKAVLHQPQGAEKAKQVSEKAKGTRLPAEGRVSSVSLRLTAPSAEGAFWGPRLRTRDFASAEATKGLSDRPLETFGSLLISSNKPKR